MCVPRMNECYAILLVEDGKAVGWSVVGKNTQVIVTLLRRSVAEGVGEMDGGYVGWREHGKQETSHNKRASA